MRTGVPAYHPRLPSGRTPPGCGRIAQRLLAMTARIGGGG
jgi:hypothetical protein